MCTAAETVKLEKALFEIYQNNTVKKLKEKSKQFFISERPASFL